MFTSRQRNLTLNINEFIKEKSSIVDNSLDVNMNRNENNTLEKLHFKVIKSIMFNDNRLKLEN